MSAGEIKDESPDTLAMMYVAPVITFIGICDRQPEREAECLKMLKAHVSLFFNTVNLKKAAENSGNRSDN